MFVFLEAWKGVGVVCWVLISPVLPGGTGLEKLHTRPAVPALSAHQAMGGAARTTSATKVLQGHPWDGGQGWSKPVEASNYNQPKLHTPFN